MELSRQSCRDDFYCDQDVRTLTDVEDATLLAEILTVAQRIIVEQGFNDSNYKLITNGGSYQSSQHLHFRLVSGGPRHPAKAEQKGEMLV